jgi:hypothetical protein
MRFDWLGKRTTDKTFRKRSFRPMLERLEDKLAPAVFMVSNTNDFGPGSLWQAIDDANNNGGADEIDFAIPGSGVHTIHQSSQLPPITEAVFINGYSQPGSSQNTLAIGDNAVLQIEIDGSLAPSFLFTFMGGGGSTVKGLVLNNYGGDYFFIGLSTASSGNTIAGNFIGTDATGSMFLTPDGRPIATSSSAAARAGPRLSTSAREAAAGASCKETTSASMLRER